MRSNLPAVGADTKITKAVSWCTYRPCRTFALLFASFVVFVILSAAPRIRLESHLVTGDGFYYYCWARSLLVDRDVNFKNEYEEFGPVCMGKTMIPLSGDQTSRPPGLEKGRLLPDEASDSRAPSHYGPWEGEFPDYPGNMWAIGSAILWMPFLAVVHWAILLLRAIGVTSVSADGYGAAYQCAVAVGSNFYAFLGACLLVRTLERQFDRGACLFSVLSLVTASALVSYLVYQVAYSHAQEFFACSLLFYLLMKSPSFAKMIYAHAFLVGASIGLAAMVRWQTAVWGIVPLGLWIRSLAVERRRGEVFLKGLILALGAVLTFLPQSLAWKSMYGGYLTVPQTADWGSAFFRFRFKEMLLVLFSNNHGMFFWHPVLLVGFVGTLFVFSRRLSVAAGTKTVIVLSLVVFALTAFINGTVADWWGGSAFGMRRMIGMYPLVGWGLAAFLARFRLVEARPLLVTCAWLVAGAWNAVLLFLWIFHLGGRWLPH